MKVFLCFLIFAYPLWADLLVFPTRVELDDQTNFAYVSLRHRGTLPTRYKITSVFYRMSENGAMVVASDVLPYERSAQTLIRYSPKEVTLQPNVEQTVRIKFVKPAINTERGVSNFPFGDYRIHLHFEPIEELSDTPPNSSENKENKNISMQLKARIAIAIPIIYHHGDPDYQVELSHLVLDMKDKQNPSFKAVMISKGSYFPFGDLFFYYIPTEGSSIEVGRYMGISSYIPKRTLSFPIDKKDRTLSQGKYRLEFKEPIEKGGKVLASTEIRLLKENYFVPIQPNQESSLQKANTVSIMTFSRDEGGFFPYDVPLQPLPLMSMARY